MIMAIAALAMSAPPPIDLDRMLRAIVAMEGAQWNSPGGALQFTVAAWEEETAMPYSLSRNPHVAPTVARQRLTRFRDRFLALGITATPWLMACAWHRGFDGAINAHRHHLHSDYADRAANYYTAYP